MAVCSSKIASDPLPFNLHNQLEPWNVIPGKLGVDLHLHRVHIPLVRLSVPVQVIDWKDSSPK